MTDERLSLAIVEAVAAVEGVDPTELEFSLHEFVDTGALAALDRHDGGAWTVSFEAGGHDIVVSSDGSIAVDGRVRRPDLLA